MTKKATKVIPYQDVWVCGKVVSSGQRVCDTRYNAIKPLLGKYTRPFTVLDIGASNGYFTFRIAKDFPESVVIAVEGSDEYCGYSLLDLCDKNELSNVVYLNHKLSIDDIERLGECEHFDVVLCMNVLHHLSVDTSDLQSETRRAVDAVMSLGDHVILETPTVDDIDAQGEFHGSDLITPLCNELIDRFAKSSDAELLGEFPSHVTDEVTRPMWRLSTKSVNVRRYLSFWDSLSTTDYCIASSYDTKSFYSFDDHRQWMPGINLRTYQYLGGCYPGREILTGEFPDLSNENIPHGDIRPWNIIIQGNQLELIDGGVDDERAIYDDVESFVELSRELIDDNLLTVDEWLQVGRHTLCVLTPFRNAAKHLETYFSQLDALRKEITPLQLRLVAAEGDSLDGTRELLQEYAEQYELDYELVDTTHGKRYWRSVEDPERLRMMSGVMNAALDAVRPSDDVVLWIMSDVTYDVPMLAQLCGMQNGDSSRVLAPLAMMEDNRHFWDTWAFRRNGKRFSARPPYTSFEADGFTELDSAGTCLVMPGIIARNYRATDLEAVSFCESVRTDGYKIYTEPGWRVHHHKEALRRLLVVGELLTHTGMSRAMENVLPHLSRLGYEIDVVVIGLSAAQLLNVDYFCRLWPGVALRDDPVDGSGQFLRMLTSFKPYDMCIVALDLWDYANYPRAFEFASKQLSDNGRDDYINSLEKVAWTSADTGNHGAHSGYLDVFDHVVCWTDYSVNQLATMGSGDGYYVGNWSVVPLGVDTKLFSFIDEETRKLNRAEILGTTLPGAFFTSSSGDSIAQEDLFIIGLVGRNTRRKRVQDAIRIFADLVHVKGVENARLLLHVVDAPPWNDCDIVSLCEYYNLNGKYVVIPNVVPDEVMVKLYSSMDVLLVTSISEGWCYPAMEALSIGTPVIYPQWGPMGEWMGEIPTAYGVSPGDVEVVAPVNTAHGPYTVGRRIDAAKMLWQLRCIINNYPSKEARKTSRSVIQSNYESSIVGEEFAQCVSGCSVRTHGVQRVLNDEDAAEVLVRAGVK